ncbi:MAG TPA: tetratricopeptide repeat protein [Gemmatimonadaceae bacterium]|nr:tetratricopeptide repeat protein [Gemmatimonadaceae bacterium]
MSSSTSAKRGPGLEPPTRRARERHNPGAEPSGRRSLQLTILTCLGLAAITVVAFAAVRRFGFVDYDDFDYVATNPHVTPGLTSQGIWWAFTSGYAANWHPLTWLSHMLDVQLFGMNAGAHHLVSLGFHVANTLLLFAVMSRMTGSEWRSAFVAALFAIHPMHVESVAWIAERKDVLSTFFFLLTLWAYAEYVRRRAWQWYAAVVGCLALGLMAKPMLVTLPFVLLLLDYWPLRRRIDGKVLIEKLPLIALAIASSVVTVVVQRSAGAVMRLELMPFPVRLANGVVSYAEYFLKLAWPVNLVAMYPARRTLPEIGPLAGALAVLLTVTILAIRLARQRPYLIVGWLWFIGTLVPVIGIVQVGAQSIADRYSYIPSVGLFIILAWGASDLVARWPRVRFAVATAAVIVIAACTAATIRQVQYWRSSHALWEHAVAATRDNYFAHASFGYVLWKEGHADEAIPHLDESLRLRPDFVEAHNNLGVVLAGRGDLRGALSQFSEALRIEPAYKAARDNFAATNSRLTAPDTSLARYVEAVRARPNDLAARNELGAALAAQGRVDEAIEQFNEAIRIDPNQPDVHFNLGAMLDRKGRTADAVDQFRIALRLNPVHAAAREALDAITRRGRAR